MKLTAVIVCRSRREREFRRALKSVEFADEILVEERRGISDFAAARNEALKKARGEWVLFVDSDELISDALTSEIKSQISNLKSQNHSSKFKTDKINGFYIKRRDRFFGKWLKYGETANVKLVRLAKKDAGRWIRPVHEVWKIDGKVSELKNPLLHYSHDSIEGMTEKLDRYSSIEAEYRKRRWAPAVRSPLPWSTSTHRGVATTGFGRTLPANSYAVAGGGPSEKFADLRILGEMILYPMGKFVWNYLFRLGFMDGMGGFIHAGVMSFHSFLVRAKLLERYEWIN